MMRNNLRQVLTLFLVLLFVCVPIKAQIWNDIGRVAGNVVNTAVNVATAPAQVLINTGRVVTGNANPSEIYRPYQDVARNAGSTTQAATQLVANPERFLYERVSAAAGLAGAPGKFIFDVQTFQSQLLAELGSSALNYTGAALQGQNPFEITGAVVAAAIRSAHDQFAPDAKPLPDDVKAGLAPYFPASTLNRAKYAVGDVRINLPNFINLGNKLFTTDHAVTLDDIIVFNAQPPTFAQDPAWWGHEVTHVRQYEVWGGIEAFAYQYTYHSSQIEDFAKHNGALIAGHQNPIPVTQDVAISFNMATQIPSENGPGAPNYSQAPEYYVARCIFPSDQFPVMYMITNYGRIVAVSPYTGEWRHIGWATPPRFPATAWTYQTPNLIYDVRTNGAIIAPAPIYDMWGRVVNVREVQVGYVVRFKEESMNLN